MKICSKCKEEKEFTEFGKNKQAKDGHKSSCKKCLREDNRLYYANNVEKESVRKKKQYERDFDKIIKKSLEYYYTHIDERAQWVKNKRQEQPEVFQKYTKQFNETHPGHHNAYSKKRRKIDPLFKLQSILRTRTSQLIKIKRFNKNNKFTEYLGCNLDCLKLHLENQFQPGMTWENHTRDGWHIDHIVPLDSANTEEELYKLCHYTNLQPLWAEANLKKSNKKKAQVKPEP